MNSGNMFSRSTPRQVHNHDLNNNAEPPSRAANNTQFEGNWENTPPPTGYFSVPGRPQDLCRIDLAGHGMVDHRSLPLDDHAAPSPFPIVRYQGISVQGQSIVSENEFHGHTSQRSAPGPAQAAFPDQFAHQIPASVQPAAENLRQLAIRYLHQPNSRVEMIHLEPGATGPCKVVIILEPVDVL